MAITALASADMGMRHHMVHVMALPVEQAVSKA